MAEEILSSHLKTEHGIINFENKIGICYITHRKKEHFFKKFLGFGVSISEIDVALNNNVEWIVIIYHRTDGGQDVFRYKLNKISELSEFDHNGNVQKIFPIKVMEKMN